MTKDKDYAHGPQV